jgi:DNA-binding transcriptional ArsR family regulator
MVHHQLDNLDRVFTALGEPTRRAMLERLASGGATLAELAAPFAMSLQAAIKHARMLEEAGLVRIERVGRANFVTLIPDPMLAATAWLVARTPVPTPVPRASAERQTDLLARARGLAERLQPRIARLHQALAADSDSPLATQRDRRASAEEALRLYDALTRQLAGEPDLDVLRDLTLPLGRLMYELEPLLPAHRAA